MANHPMLDKPTDAMIEAGIGVCAYDLDECTVTLALDDAAAVLAMVKRLPSKHRVMLCDDATLTPDPVQSDGEVAKLIADCLPDDIDIFRLLKHAGRKRTDQVKALSGLIEDIRAALTRLTSLFAPVEKD